uniref:Uncharacterized protein n=1 Tax=Nelumbo nucifera TaxID=4432 RepID=A0A822XHK4_NELNU|nr:TPA_asm: hypothetical protein HUJ06_020616 [Nelumbo nucifera]
MKEQEKGDGEREGLAIWDCGSPLYDSFELASLTHLIERHLMILPFSCLSTCKFTGIFSDASTPTPSSLSTTDAASPANKLSKVGSLNEFLGKYRWRRKMREEEKKEKAKKKKQQQVGLYGFLNRIGIGLCGRN